MPSNFQLPLPPSRDQILGNLEEIKQQYKQQEKDWNILLKNSLPSFCLPSKLENF